jgi:hypothetical protein
LRQFDPNGELPVDMAERQQYAAWKAADIRKALREGRVPQAGPPVNDDDLGLPDIPGWISLEGARTQEGVALMIGPSLGSWGRDRGEGLGTPLRDARPVMLPYLLSLQGRDWFFNAWGMEVNVR